MFKVFCREACLVILPTAPVIPGKEISQRQIPQRVCRTTLQVNTALEISSSEGRAKALYEEGDARFVISLEGLDDFDDIESSLMTLTLLVETGGVSWRCSVESQGCEEVDP